MPLYLSLSLSLSLSLWVAGRRRDLTEKSLIYREVGDYGRKRVREGGEGELKDPFLSVTCLSSLSSPLLSLPLSHSLTLWLKKSQLMDGKETRGNALLLPSSHTDTHKQIDFLLITCLTLCVCDCVDISGRQPALYNTWYLRLWAAPAWFPPPPPPLGCF